MRILSAFAFATGLLVTPVAMAQPEAITVEFEYDSNLLATEEGAKLVLATINEQAKTACSYTKPVYGTPSFDRECRDDLVEKAIGQIRLAALEDGKAATLVFASLDTSDVVANQ